MRIALLRGENLRAYAAFELWPHHKLNLVVGPNAAGKTTLLEAAYVLGRGRSFRSSDLEELAGTARPQWSLHGRYAGDYGETRAGASWSPAGLVQRLDEAPSRTAVVARALPLQIIDPAGHRLVEEGPGYRRSYLDWGVFHVEPGFLSVWQRYQRNLRQRNQALRASEPDAVVRAWDAELSIAAEELSRLRLAHVEQLARRVPQLAEALLGAELRIEFHRGWPVEQEYRSVLQEQLAQHRRLGTTLQGPHRAELKVQLDRHRAKGRISRGQQKLLVATLVLAQCAILIDAGISPPVMLVDDFGAELSADYQMRLAKALGAYPGQVFVSAFEIPMAFQEQVGSVFHVEHGRIERVSAL